MSTTAKCAHPACSCLAPEGKSYCSDSCERAKDLTELACQCQHPECRGELLK
jgi:metallothionein